ncbi:hypothetical protein [Streptomyces sp. NPDC060243]|uniref:hypothetical protein n=1 Tax=Streptomyces sp. NPDC060243 TaxID=3347081 RepID=UPI003646809E
MAQLKSTVFLQDPQTHQTVRLDPGTSPPAHLAALITNPAAWVDGKLPRLPKGSEPSSASAGEDVQADRKPSAPKPARGRKAADSTGDGGQ